MGHFKCDYIRRLTAITSDYIKRLTISYDFDSAIAIKTVRFTSDHIKWLSCVLTDLTTKSGRLEFSHRLSQFLFELRPNILDEFDNLVVDSLFWTIVTAFHHLRNNREPLLKQVS